MGVMTGALIMKNFIGMLLGPALLHGLSCVKYRGTSATVIGFRKNEVIFCGIS